MIDTKEEPLAVPVYCYSYYRISSPSQAKGGGIMRQVEAAEKTCDENGWTMDTSFHLTDIGISAYHSKNLDDRAALGGFIKAAESGLIKLPAVLLVESLDRLSRANIMDALELFIRILNLGISIYTHYDRIHYSKESIQANFGPLLISITIMCRAHEESLIKSARTKAGWQQMVERMKAGGVGRKSIYPPWITIENGKPEIIKSEARIVREIFDLCIEQNMSYSAIGRQLREKYDRNYTGSMLGKIFHKKRALGIFSPSDIEEIQAYPAIVSEDIFYTAQARIKERLNTGVGRGTKKINFFKTKLRCSECGTAMRMNRSNTSSTYVCRRKQELRDCSQSSKLEVGSFQSILLYALSLVGTDDLIGKSSSDKLQKLGKALAVEQAKLDEKRQRIKNLAELVAAGSKTGASMVMKTESEIQEIEVSITALQSELDRLQSPSLPRNVQYIFQFNRRYSLGEVTKADQEPFVNALRKVVDRIVINSPVAAEQRTLVDIHLVSGVQVSIVVLKDYTAEILKDGTRIGRHIMMKK
ncbi:recombinase family protein [Endozoicomonas ascidiicola]|uniref:recombinase family protein n=1 Tax=Endozoicomonas ascidiicola TaxID=1698521 RepID=UPI000829E6B9|nr:recombinase family protein [Endozoicomonas ascidiicola]